MNEPEKLERCDDYRDYLSQLGECLLRRAQLAERLDYLRKLARRQKENSRHYKWGSTDRYLNLSDHYATKAKIAECEKESDNNEMKVRELSDMVSNCYIPPIRECLEPDEDIDEYVDEVTEADGNNIAESPGAEEQPKDEEQPKAEKQPDAKESPEDEDTLSGIDEDADLM